MVGGLFSTAGTLIVRKAEGGSQTIFRKKCKKKMQETTTPCMFCFHLVHTAVSHTACKDEFRRNLRSHSWSVFSFFIVLDYSIRLEC